MENAESKLEKKLGTSLFTTFKLLDELFVPTSFMRNTIATKKLTNKTRAYAITIACEVARIGLYSYGIYGLLN